MCGGSNRAGNCAEGALVPALAAVGNVQKNFGSTQSIAGLEQLEASIAAQLTVPLYQGGSEYAAIRQAKETRPGAGERDPGLGAARGRQGADRCRPVAVHRLRNGV